MKKRLVKYCKDPGLVKSSHFIGKASGSKRGHLPVTHCTPGFVLQFWYLLLPLSFFPQGEKGGRPDQCDELPFCVLDGDCVLCDGRLRWIVGKVLSFSSSLWVCPGPRNQDLWSPTHYLNYRSALSRMVAMEHLLVWLVKNGMYWKQKIHPRFYYLAT